jgi:hypothetical protein
MREAVLRVEGHGVGLRVDHHASAAELAGHLDREIYDEAEKLRAEPLPPRFGVAGQTGRTQHRQGIPGSFLRTLSGNASISSCLGVTVAKPTIRSRSTAT